MKHEEMKALVGKKALLRVESLAVEVTIEDARSAYGRIDVLVAPVGGTGRQWVDMARVDLVKPVPAA